MLTGGNIGADKAMKMGVVHQLVDPLGMFYVWHFLIAALHKEDSAVFLLESSAVCSSRRRWAGIRLLCVCLLQVLVWSLLRRGLLNTFRRLRRAWPRESPTRRLPTQKQKSLMQSEWRLVHTKSRQISWLTCSCAQTLNDWQEAMWSQSANRMS